MQRVLTPDKDHLFQNIALTLSDGNAYGKDPSYTGATLGPSAGRIPEGKLCIGGTVWPLSQNEGSTHLHGGFSSFSQVEWDIVERQKHTDSMSVTFGLAVQDGVDGYPGLRQVYVKYTLDDNNRLTIDYTATTDKPTYFNLSNHCYWNLSGDFSSDVMDHSLQIPSHQMRMNDSGFLPCPSAEEVSPPFDFRQPCCIGEKLTKNKHAPQIESARGYNHYFLLNQSPAADLSHKASGRTLKVYTDYPETVLYTGGFLDGRTVLPGEVPAHPGCALALEPQEKPLPEGGLVENPTFPEEKWRRSICYEFGVLAQE